ncbi:MAG: PEP/pyruvate-binding domain-containing protein, partial [Dehalococcoidia bacterium]
MSTKYVRWFEDTGSEDVAEVGGKNASLGEMVSRLTEAGISVPAGFAVTVAAYRRFVEHNGLTDAIAEQLAALERGDAPLEQTGQALRRLLLQGEFPKDVATEVRAAYLEFCRRSGRDQLDVAVRSSATAEDLPGVSFAGQHESYLNVVGEDALIDSCRRCFASLFTDRAITYRDEMGFDHLKVYVSVGVQRMVHSDRSGAGVMFTLDTESG